MLECPCQAAATLCERCRDARFAQLRGVACRRGEVLAERLRRPPTDAEIRGCVADLSRDAALLELLFGQAERFARPR